jgi:hypothetical protein
MKNYLGRETENLTFNRGENCENCENYGVCKFSDNENGVCPLWSMDWENFTICDNCNNIVNREDITHTSDTDCDYCCDCNGDLYYCEDCCEYFENSDSVYYIENRNCYVCSDCYENDNYFYCDDCGSYYSGYSNTALNSYNDEITLCDSCFENCNYCDDCDIYYIGDFCPNCENEKRKLIKNYSYKPTPLFFGDYNKLNYGVELETEQNPYDFASELTNNEKVKNHIYCKRDGSLDNGVEIVSHPADKNSLLDIYKTVMEIGLNNGVVSWNNSNCGLHIHISREHISKFAKTDNKQLIESVITYAFGKFQNLWEKIAGRKGNHYCEYRYFDNLTDCFEHQYNFDYDRYKAVNTCNENTIEIRVFKGTLKFEMFKLRFDFLEAFILGLCDIIKANNNSYDIYKNVEAIGKAIDNASIFDIIGENNENDLIGYVEDCLSKINR